MAKLEEFSPLWVSAPGETILDALRDRKLSVSAFADQMCESQDQVESLLAGRVAITIGRARRLSALLGGSVEFWMTRDSQYREDVGQQQAADAKSWLSELPLGDMVKFGWIASTHPSEEYESCLRFFGVSNVAEWRKTYAFVNAEVAFRTSPSIDSRLGSVAAWLRRGAIEAATLNCDTWNPDALRGQLEALRRLTRFNKPERFIPELQRRCASCGVAVVIIRAPSGCRASGATYFLDNARPVIILSSRFLTDDQFWFTFFHEVGHLLMHAQHKLILEGLGDSSCAEEDQANAFAESVIIPIRLVDSFKRLRADSHQIIRFARTAGVSAGLVVGQLQHRQVLKQNQMNRLKRRFAWSSMGLVSRETS